MMSLKHVLFASVLMLSTSALAKPIDRLSSAERDHFQALSVWMDDKEERAYLKLKTEEERNAWLKEKGYWNRYYQYDAQTRDQILGGKVAVGWTQDMVFMAWGAPHDKRRLLGRNARRSEALIYRFEVTPDGAHLIWAPKSKATHNAVQLYHYVLTVDDAKVVKMERNEGWD